MRAVESLRRAAAARARAEIDEAEAIAELAAQCEWPADATFDVVGRRPVRIGADGTALVDEFLPLEVAAAKEISVSAATWLIRDVVNLRTRHPLLWTQARRGVVAMFRAFQLVEEIGRFDLSLDEALEVDARLAPKVGGLAWPRVLKLARGLVAEVAAGKVEALAEQGRQARFVRKLPTEDPMIAYLSARVDTADAVFFDAMVDRIADILGDRGDEDTRDVRRAKAIGVLATPARAHLMLQEAAGRPGRVRSTDPRLLPTVTVYVHVAEETLLTGRGVCRVEEIGPLAATMLKHLVGSNRIRVTPVIRPYADIAVDSYEIPDRDPAPGAAPRPGRGVSVQQSARARQGPRPHRRLAARSEAADPGSEPRTAPPTATPREDPRRLAARPAASRHLLVAITRRSALPDHPERHPPHRRQPALRPVRPHPVATRPPRAARSRLLTRAVPAYPRPSSSSSRASSASMSSGLVPR